MKFHIRTESSSDSVHLADIPPTKEAIDEVFALLHSWGVVADGDYMGDPFGQFRIEHDRNSAYFEVVVPGA